MLFFVRHKKGLQTVPKKTEVIFLVQVAFVSNNFYRLQMMKTLSDERKRDSRKLKKEKNNSFTKSKIGIQRFQRGILKRKLPFMRSGKIFIRYLRLRCL